jgi:hypothetical protein
VAYYLLCVFFSNAQKSLRSAQCIFCNEFGNVSVQLGANLTTAEFSTMYNAKAVGSRLERFKER